MSEILVETAPVEEREASKVEIYEQIAAYVKNKTGKRIGKTGGKDIFELVTEKVFEIAVKNGSFRFNGGFGSLHMKTYQAGTRRLPSGVETTFGERTKIRYEQGLVTSALVSNGGDLAAALKERGKRVSNAVPELEVNPDEDSVGDLC